MSLNKKYSWIRLLLIALSLVIIFCYVIKSQPTLDLIIQKLSENEISNIHSEDNKLESEGEQLPARWQLTTQGYTVDCCTGSRNTEYWPPRFLVGKELTLQQEPERLKFEDAKYRKKIFLDIFSKRIWGSERKTNNETLSASGPGSTLAAATRVGQTLDCVIEDLKAALKKARISILDVPCGDLVWMSVFLQNRTDVDYTGMDIVPDIIHHHNKVYTHTNWTFRVHDIVAEPLSESYDLIFTRDMTAHLTTGDTMKVLRHFSISGSKFAMFSTYPVGTAHSGIDTGVHRYRRQNLEAAPYSLIPPVCVRRDKAITQYQYSALWQLPLKQKTS